MPKIEFFREDMSLGVFDIPNGTDEEQRRSVATKNNVKHWNRYVVDDGRFEVVKYKIGQEIIIHDKETMIMLTYPMVRFPKEPKQKVFKLAMPEEDGTE